MRQTIAQLVTQTEVARVLGLRFVAASMEGGASRRRSRPRSTSSTRPSSRSASPTRRCDIAGPGAQLRVHTEDAPLTRPRRDRRYRYTVIDTIGGGASEIQKNIIARRKLGLPKNF